MSFARWAAQSFADGTHRLEVLPLDVLHPLRHGFLPVTLDIADGRITRCSFDPSANHRGDEKLLEVRDVRQGLALIDRHGWLTAPFAETLYARIVEGLLGITVSERACALRELTLALDAAAVEALWQHLEASLLGESDSAALQRREALVQELECLTGARMHTGYVRIGGVAAGIEPAQLQRLQADPDARIAAAAEAVASETGVLAVQLPKVVRLPQAEAYAEIDTPHGRLGMWVVGRGDKVPHRVHLRTAGFRALADLERESVGMGTEAFLLRLARTRLVLGEVAR